MKFHNGFKDIKVKLINWEGENLAKKVYEFGRLSHDYNEVLPEAYDKDNPACIKLIQKIIDGKTLPKMALQGHRFAFEIDNISRICLAQLTRDSAIFASQGGGVHALSQEFNLPLSITQYDDVMDKIKEAQWLLEEAYIMLAEREVPALEARYIGLHSQVISLTASYIPTDFVRSCYSRTSSNFCDECNYIYRKMFNCLKNAIDRLNDKNSIKLWKWLINESNCINDAIYTRERLYCSDFTTPGQNNQGNYAINDWRRSGWKLELERMLDEEPYLLTDYEMALIKTWKSMQEDYVNAFPDKSCIDVLSTSYNSNEADVLCNCIKETDYYKEHRKSLHL